MERLAALRIPETSEWLARQIIICQSGAPDEVRQAWEEIAKHILPLLSKLASEELRRVWPSMARNSALAQDVAAETCLRFVRSIYSIPRPQGACAWLRVVARRIILDHKKSAYYARVALVNYYSEGVRAACASSQTDAYRELDIAQVVRNALLALRQEDRQLIYDRYFLDKPTCQIAQETGMTKAAVNARLYRIRQALRIIISQ